MKKIIISALLILFFGGWIIAQHSDGGHRVIAPNPNPVGTTDANIPAANTPAGGTGTSAPSESTNPSAGTPASGAGSGSTGSSGSSPSASGSTASTGRYKDGSYTGSVVDAYYGYVQVKAIVSGGNLTDVVFLQYPNDRRESIQINSEAMPLLKQEAIQAQGSNVGGVSGASDTSAAFIQSLHAALVQAL